MKRIAFFAILIASTITAKEEHDDEHITIGNLALSASQQPGPLFSFGQNVIDGKTIQAILTGGVLQGPSKLYAEITGAFLYAFTDSFSFILTVPGAVKFKLNQAESHGIEDVCAQIEWAYHSKTEWTYGDQLTAVANMTFPSGSATKDPATGYGSPSFFLGLTANRTSVNWYYYASVGGLLTTRNYLDEKFGNQAFYQWGIGKNIPTSNDWIITPMVEFNGLFIQEGGSIQHPNTSGNFIMLGPSIWIANKDFAVQAGFQFFPVQPVPADQQEKNTFMASISMRWTFR